MRELKARQALHRKILQLTRLVTQLIIQTIMMLLRKLQIQTMLLIQSKSID